MAATVRMTLAEALARPSTVDRATIDATTEAEIAAYQAEDGMAGVDDLLDTARLVLPPGAVRARFGMTQREFAELLGVPVASWRNWEQLRTGLPPGMRALLNILDREPEAARRALGWPVAPP